MLSKTLQDDRLGRTLMVQVVSVKRVESPRLWRDYALQRRQIRSSVMTALRMNTNSAACECQLVSLSPLECVCIGDLICLRSRLAMDFEEGSLQLDQVSNEQRLWYGTGSVNAERLIAESEIGLDFRYTVDAVSELRGGQHPTRGAMSHIFLAEAVVRVGSPPGRVGPLLQPLRASLIAPHSLARRRARRTRHRA
jgi:hypothetical protein